MFHNRFAWLHNPPMVRILRILLKVILGLKIHLWILLLPQKMILVHMDYLKSMKISYKVTKNLKLWENHHLSESNLLKHTLLFQKKLFEIYKTQTRFLNSHQFRSFARLEHLDRFWILIFNLLYLKSLFKCQIFIKKKLHLWLRVNWLLLLNLTFDYIFISFIIIYKLSPYYYCSKN